MVKRMKIFLAKINEGLNQRQFQASPEHFGFDEQEETLIMFPNEINANVEVQ
jgi:hypothetical protein